MNEKEKSIIKITYLEENDNGYQEKRSYEGSFGRLQVLRTMVGLYNDVILAHHHKEDNVAQEDLEMLGDKIEALLQQGEIKNAN